jgi:hypothetical protein
MHSRMRKLALLSLTGMLALGLVTVVCAIGIGSSQAQQGAMQNCPQAGKWAISVWSGDDGADAEQAFATCDDAEVAVAYSIDPETQAWSRWFSDRPDISTLTLLNDMQGVLALGAFEPTLPPSPTPSPTPVATPTPAPASLTEEGVAAVVKLVAAPEGTGLPGEPRVTVDPGGVSYPSLYTSLLRNRTLSTG